MRRRPIRQERAWQNNQSLHQLDLAQPPFLREERFARAIETKDREPALAGHGLDPVAILCIGWPGWSEIDCRGAVGVRDGSRRRVRLASGTRKALRCLKHGASLVVVGRERPVRVLMLSGVCARAFAKPDNAVAVSSAVPPRRRSRRSMPARRGKSCCCGPLSDRSLLMALSVGDSYR